MRITQPYQATALAALLLASAACGSSAATGQKESASPTDDGNTSPGHAAMSDHENHEGQGHDGHDHPGHDGHDHPGHDGHDHHAHAGHVHDDDVSGVVGKPAPAWNLARWFNSEPVTLESLRGQVVLVRWFMSPECPFCSATAPSLRDFHQAYRDRGLRVIGMYHHKREEPLDPEAVRGYIEHFGFEFPVAIDADWQTLRRWWLDGHARAFTSVSFLLDRQGVIRHVHIGGKYEKGDADYQEMQRHIETLLGESDGTERTF